LNIVDKTLLVGGARISYCIWEVGGIYIYIYIYMVDFFLILFIYFLKVNPCLFVSFRHHLFIHIINDCIYMLAGDKKAWDHVPAACKDSVAILLMFDLTSRCTLNK